MRYMDALKALFKHPQWGKQVLFTSICSLIPIVGNIALLGHFLGVFVHQRENDPQTYAPFDFGRLGEYLGKGIWPFLALLISGVISVPCIFVAMAPVFLASAIGLEGALVALAGFISLVLYLVVICAIMVLQVPLCIKAGLTQNLGAALSWSFVRDFAKKVTGPILLANLFLFALAIPGTIVGILTCGLGIFPLVAIMLFTQWQLFGQIYQLYLDRGGEVINIHPKLKFGS